MAVNYKEYLASREWALLRERVRERSGDCCERCQGPMQAVHHLTYERVGHERLEDLQAVCNPCHEFLSAKRDDDPADYAGDLTDEIRQRWPEIYHSVRELQHRAGAILNSDCGIVEATRERIVVGFRHLMLLDRACEDPPCAVIRVGIWRVVGYGFEIDLRLAPDVPVIRITPEPQPRPVEIGW